MVISIYVAPHERSEAIEAYRDRLTSENVEAIRNAPDGLTIHILIGPERTQVAAFDERPTSSC